MGSASTPALAAAVSNAGGLGGLGMWGRSADQAARRIPGFHQQSGGSLNVNSIKQRVSPRVELRWGSNIIIDGLPGKKPGFGSFIRHIDTRP